MSFVLEFVRSSIKKNYTLLKYLHNISENLLDKKFRVSFHIACLKPFHNQLPFSIVMQEYNTHKQEEARKDFIKSQTPEEDKIRKEKEAQVHKEQYSFLSRSSSFLSKLKSKTTKNNAKQSCSNSINFKLEQNL